MLHGLWAHSFKNSAPCSLVSGSPFMVPVHVQKGRWVEGLLHPCIQAQAGAGLNHLCVDHGIGVTGLGGSEPDSDQVSPVSLGA